MVLTVHDDTAATGGLHDDAATAGGYQRRHVSIRYRRDDGALHILEASYSHCFWT